MPGTAVSDTPMSLQGDHRKFNHGLWTSEVEAGVGGQQSREDLLHSEEAPGGDQSGHRVQLPLPRLPHRQRR